MNYLEDTIRKIANTTVLTRAEKESMREYLREYRLYLPVRTSQPPTSAPLIDFFRAIQTKTVAWGLLGSFVLMTSGISYAAEGAVPGDSLYGLKVHVNEEIVRLFTFGAEAQALWEARRAERRLEEAGKLAAEGFLTPERERQVSEQFEKHVARVTEQTALFKDEDPVRASDVSNLLESSFSAHEAILISLAIEQQLSAETVKTLVEKVRHVAREFARVHSQTEEIIALTVNPSPHDTPESATLEFDEHASVQEQRILVQRMRDSAEQSLRTARNRLTRLSLVGGLNLQASQHRLAETDKVFAHARELYTQGEYALAYKRYKAARSVADRLTRFLDAHQALAIDALALDLAEELLFASDASGGNASTVAEVVLGTLEEREATIEETISALSLEEVLAHMSSSTRVSAEELLKRARALIFRATLARSTGDEQEAERYYLSAEQALSEVRTLLLLPQAPEEGVGNHVGEEKTDSTTSSGTPDSVSVQILRENDRAHITVHNLSHSEYCGPLLASAGRVEDVEMKLRIELTSVEKTIPCAEKSSSTETVLLELLKYPPEVPIAAVLLDGIAVSFSEMRAGEMETKAL